MSFDPGIFTGRSGWTTQRLAESSGTTGAIEGDEENLVELRRLYDTLRPELRKWREGRERELVRYRLEVLKNQTRAAKILMDWEKAKAEIYQDDVQSQRQAIAKLQSDILDSQTALEKSIATYDERALARARTAWSMNQRDNKEAWKSISDTLFERGTEDVLSAQLPKTVEKMLAEYARGVVNYTVNDDGTIRLGNFVTVDPTFNDSIRELVNNANVVTSQRNSQQQNINRSKRRLDSMLNGFESKNEDERAEIINNAQEYAKQVLDNSKVDYQGAEEDLKAALERDKDYQLLRTESEILHERIFGTDKKSSILDERGQMIKDLIDSGWATDHNFDISTLGQTFDTDGDGYVDMYVPGAKDRDIILAWDRERSKGAGRYGPLRTGRTREIVEFKIRPSEEELAKLAHDDGSFYYTEGEDGKRKYVSREDLQKQRKQEQQASKAVNNLSKDRLTFFKDSDGKVYAATVVDVEGKSVVKVYEADKDENSISLLSGDDSTKAVEASKQADVLLFADAPEADEAKGLKSLIEGSTKFKKVDPVEYKPDSKVPEDYLITVTGERFKTNATDMITHKEGGIRVEGQGFFSSKDIVGEVTVVEKYPTADLFGSDGKIRKKIADLRLPKQRELLAKRGEDYSEVTTNGVTYRQYGPVKEGPIRSLFNIEKDKDRKKKERGPRDKKSLLDFLKKESEDNQAEGTRDPKLEEQIAELEDDKKKDLSRRRRRQLEKAREEARGVGVTEDRLKKQLDDVGLPEAEYLENKEAIAAEQEGKNKLQKQLDAIDKLLKEKNIDAKTHSDAYDNIVDAAAVRGIGKAPSRDESLFDLAGPYDKEPTEITFEEEEVDPSLLSVDPERVPSPSRQADLPVTAETPTPRPRTHVGALSEDKRKKEMYDILPKEDLKRREKDLATLRKITLNFGTKRTFTPSMSGEGDAERIKELKEQGALFTGMALESYPPKLAYMLPVDKDYKEAVRIDTLWGLKRSEVPSWRAEPEQHQKIVDEMKEVGKQIEKQKEEEAKKRAWQEMMKSLKSVKSLEPEPEPEPESEPEPEPESEPEPKSVVGLKPEKDNRKALESKFPQAPEPSTAFKNLSAALGRIKGKQQKKRALDRLKPAEGPGAVEVPSAGTLEPEETLEKAQKSPKE